MGKLGGRSRQWLLDGLVNDYKPIPEYGLRVILAFSPRTSFLVPLDRCVHFAATAIKQGARGKAAKVDPPATGSAALCNAPCCLLFTAAHPALHAANSEHQRENAVQLVHVCLGTLMKAGLPRPLAMESSVALFALQEALFTGL